MKAYLVFSLLIIFSTCCFGQNPTTLYVEEIWDEEQEEWITLEERSWKFNTRRQNIEYKKRVFDDFTLELESDRELFYRYDRTGNIISTRTKSIYPSTTEEGLQEFQFNDFNQRTAVVNSTINSDGLVVQHSLDEYEYENLFSKDWINKKNYNRSDVNLDWELAAETNKNFDSNECLLNSESITYQNAFADTTIYSTHYVRDDACRIGTSERWFFNTEDNSPRVLTSRNIYEYPGNGLNYNLLSQRKHFITGDLFDTFYKKEEFDTEGRSIRTFEVNLTNSDTTIVSNTYTDEGLIYVKNELNVSYDSNGSPDYTVRIDSFEYQYDQGLLVQEKYTYTNTFDWQYHRTTTYEYYCNGQLKSKTATHSNQLPTDRIRYEYLADVDCGLSQETASLTIFPNPTSGELFILSNVLDAQDARYALYSITGQLLRSGEFPQSFTPTEIELGAEYANGYYVLKLFTEDIVVAEKFVLIH